MHLTTRESERLSLAFILSLGIHLALFLVLLMLPEFREVPVRPVSLPIQISFESEPRPEPPPPEPVPERPVPERSPEPVPRTEPAASVRSSRPGSTVPPKASGEVSDGGARAAPEEPWVPEPEPSIQQTFTSKREQTLQGGRLTDSQSSDTRADPNLTSRARGAESGDTSVQARSGGGDSGSSGLASEDLTRLDRALAEARSGAPSGGSGGRLTQKVEVSGIENIEEALKYRGANYRPLPKLSDEAAQELRVSRVPQITVEVNFTISPLGSIDGLQTSVSSVYPALDAFLRSNLPRVLSFEPLTGLYANLWQEVTLELSVKSN
jgi:outer membrane biosynthesis protein TonB